MGAVATVLARAVPTQPRGSHCSFPTAFLGRSPASSHQPDFLGLLPMYHGQRGCSTSFLHLFLEFILVQSFTIFKRSLPCNIKDQWI